MGWILFFVMIIWVYIVKKNKNDICPTCMGRQQQRYVDCDKKLSINDNDWKYVDLPQRRKV
jgi:hypothetical protein